MKGRFLILLVASCFVMACSHNNSVKVVAGYVSDPENGLTKQKSVGTKTIIGQFIPAENYENCEEHRFRIWIKNDREESTDSLLYHFNYRSSDIFRLVVGKDTLEPLLSERIANGRSDLHEFTVLFPNTKRKMETTAEMDLLVLKNQLFTSNIDFRYRYKDITKASKKLYGHDQVKN